MPWFTNVDDLMKALNSKYEPVMHIVEGENLKVEDFRIKSSVWTASRSKWMISELNTRSLLKTERRGRISF